MEIVRSRWANRGFWVFLGLYALVSVAWLLASLWRVGLHPSTRSLPALGFSAVNLLSAGILMRHSGGDQAARFLAVALIGTAAAYNGGAHLFLEAHGFRGVEFIHMAFHITAAAAYVSALLLFPDGKIFGRTPRLKRYLGILLVPVVLLGALVLSLLNLPPATLLLALVVIIVSTGFASQAYTARVGNPNEQERARTISSLLVLSVVASLVFSAMLSFANSWLDRRAWFAITNEARQEQFVFLAMAPVLALIPVALFLAIWRFELLGLKREIIQNALVFGILWVFITGPYIVVAWWIDEVGKRAAERLHLGPVVASVGITLLVVLFFERFKEWVEHRTKEVLFGDETPSYRSLAGLSSQLANVNSDEDVLQCSALWAWKATRAARSRIVLELPGRDPAPFEWPAQPPGPFGRAFVEPIPVMHGDERLGEITVAPRRKRFGKQRRRLLQDMSSISGLAFRIRLQALELDARLNGDAHEVRPFDPDGAAVPVEEGSVQ